MQKRYLVFLEKGKSGYGVYAPDLPGCVSIGSTMEEAKENMLEAIQLHLDGLYTDGEEIPQDSSESCYVTFDWTPTKLSEDQ